jgi:uncharacterized protein (TIGR00730 family)
MEDRNKTKKYVPKAEKAYNNKDFIHSVDGRTIRILSEYLYPEQYFKKYKVKGTLVFYGSARSVSTEDFKIKLKKLNDELALAPKAGKDEIQKKIDKLMTQSKITKIYDEAVELAGMLAKWSSSLDDDFKYLVCTGGGPGMMEAANRGADRVEEKSVGLNISLPFEQEPNIYITPDLNFEFHYFFMRKFWFVYYAKAIIALPGGFGTLDELMEILTLIQTKKVTKKVPIVLYSEEFWKNLINFDYLVDMGMISKSDLSLFTYANTPQEAFDYITKELIVANGIK